MGISPNHGESNWKENGKSSGSWVHVRVDRDRGSPKIRGTFFRSVYERLLAVCDLSILGSATMLIQDPS